MGQFPQLERGERGEGCRFEHDAVAGGQRGGGFPAPNWERKVPWHDRRDDTHRLAQSEIQAAARHGQRLTAETRDRTGIILEHSRPQPGLVARVADRLADLQHLQLGDFFEVFAQLAGDVEEDGGTLARRQIAPTGFPRALGGFHGRIHFGDVGSGDITERGFGGGIDERGAATGLGVAECAINEKLSRVIHSTSR